MFLAFLVLFGVLCAAIAASKGRSAIGWFLIGFFFGLIGLIILLCSSNLKEEQAHRDRQDEENRRLREKLRQEQLKIESLRMHTTERLDLHDRALQMDTRATTPTALPSGGSVPLERPAVPPPLPMQGYPPPPADDSPVWFYAADSQRFGPCTEEQIQELIASGGIAATTLVWKPPMPEWIAASRLPKFRPLFT